MSENNFNVFLNTVIKNTTITTSVNSTIRPKSFSHFSRAVIETLGKVEVHSAGLGCQ